jgi:peptidoglycan biosynthesis protein MviN/MurJ (putative lipid II flippase)
MQFIGAAGLATANVLAAIAQSYLLWRALSSRHEAINISAIFLELSKVIRAGAVMGTICLLLSTVVSMAEMGAKTGAILTVAIGVPSGASIYFALLYLLRFKDLDMIKSTLVRNLPSSR